MQGVDREHAVKCVSQSAWISLVEFFQFGALLVVDMVDVRRWSAIAVDGAVRQDRSI